MSVSLARLIRPTGCSTACSPGSHEGVGNAVSRQGEEGLKVVHLVRMQLSGNKEDILFSSVLKLYI